MPMYHLIKYSDDYLKASGSLWQYYRDEAKNYLADSKVFNQFLENS